MVHMTGSRRYCQPQECNKNLCVAIVEDHGGQSWRLPCYAPQHANVTIPCSLLLCHALVGCTDGAPAASSTEDESVLDAAAGMTGEAAGEAIDARAKSA